MMRVNVKALRHVSWCRFLSQVGSVGGCSERIRNIGIVAHIDAGKTTTSEHMLFLCGETSSVGRVDTGDTVMDFLPQERERGITIQAAAISFKWKDYNINLIDTPGHVDFTIEVERSARVLDGAVVIIDAVSGVQAQTRTVWRQTRKQGLPSLAFVNKMDRDGASFDRAILSLKSKLGANAVPLQLPVGSDSIFSGVIDLLTLTKVVWEGNSNSNTSGTSRTPQRPKVSKLAEDDEDYERAIAARQVMIESIAECDDVLMELYLSNTEKEIETKHLLSALRRTCLQGSLVPALCGASLRGKGVEPLLDAVLAFLPSPLDRPPARAIDSKGQVKMIPPDSKELCAMAFKVVHDAARGPLVYVRTFAGTLSSKQVLYNSTKGAKERLNQLLLVSADDLDGIAEIGPGNVACIVGLKHTVTGDTLVNDRSPLHTYVLDGLTIPKPVFSISIEPEKSSQQADLEAALAILSTEDPSLTVEINAESGQTLLRGIGELHLEIVCDKLKRQFNIEVATGETYVAYRESLDADSFGSSKSSSRYVYDRTVNAVKRLFAALTFEVEALGTSDDPVFGIAEEAKAILTSDEHVALLDGIKGALSRGPKGFPVVGVKVIVTGVERDTDTTPGAIRACAAVFIDQLMRGEHHALLEPIMDLEIELPVQFVGDVLSDLTVKRRAQVKEVLAAGSDEERGGTGTKSSTIMAQVPLASMLGYASSIRSLTQGEGSFSLEFCKYSPPI